MLNSDELDGFLSGTSSAPPQASSVGVCVESAELCDLWQPDEQDQFKQSNSFEDHLHTRGLITAEQMEQARSVHEKTPRKRLGQILLEMGVISEEDLLACLAEQYELPFVRVQRDMVDRKAFELLDAAFIESHNVLGLKIEAGKLVIGTADPTNVFLLDDVQRKVGMPLVVNVCPPSDIKAVLESFNENTSDYGVDDIIQNAEEVDLQVVTTEEEEIADVEREAGESPIIKFVNYVVLNAVKEGASDVHIEPGDKKLRIRYRIDGVLFETLNPPHTMHAAVVSRIKIMANMDIAERRLPQDGRIRVMIHGRKVDMRVSTLPSTYGEKVVVRVLDTGRSALSLTDLGLEADMMEILDRQFHRPHGMILVTGPTGSGKSTTLYAALKTMDLQRLNVSTVEDPVEYQLDGVTQVHVMSHIGMTFGSALRSLLRQDPDVIMVGEIRDEETARIAVQASLTGHLVLSTLHTNDAPSSITRLINIGVEPYLIAASTNGVLAQRLVRRICQYCKEPQPVRDEDVEFMKMYGFSEANMYKGAGCEKCRQTGYQGRVGLYELLTVDDAYRDVITGHPTVTELRRMCKERGMLSLREDGFRKVQAGLTTFGEVMKVTESVV